jgi:type II secretory pathway component GspD/PulD (secretin)
VEGRYQFRHRGHRNPPRDHGADTAADGDVTQLDERALAADLDNRTFTLTFAQPVPVRDLLLLLVRGTTLSVVPDPAIEGTFIGELKNVTVRQALGLILPPLGLDYRVDGAFVRVGRREPETRLFDVNYLATVRTGSTLVGGASSGGGTATVSGNTSTDVFADIAGGVKMLLSPGAAFSVDRKAGLVQVTDFPERLDRVALYLDTVHDRVHRQVQIDVRVVEVELTDEDAEMVDWAAVAASAGAEGAAPSRPNMVGLRVADVNQLLAGLAAQGRVVTVAAPRVLALNNEPALVRASVDAPAARSGERPAVGGITLEVTPQISAANVVTLSLSPIVTLQDADAGQSTPAVTTIRETDTLARVADGETLVLGGFIRRRETRERQNAGTRGGWFGRTTVVTRKRIELVIMLTPKILRPVGAP